MLNLILVDDEFDARQLLKKMLANYPDCNIIAEASSVTEAYSLLKNTQPDIVFLDIELKDGTGFELLSRLPKPSFDVIFVTAYDKFALKAFQCNAIDYILKPITPDDLKKVLDKARLHQRPKNDFHKQIESLMNTMQQRKQEKLILNTSEGVHFLPLSEILYLKSEGNYTTVFTEKKERIMVSQNLGTFDYLDSYIHGNLCNKDALQQEWTFFRTHQSYIINIKAVRQLLKHEDGDFAVMNDHSKVPISRRKKDAFMEAMMLVNKPNYLPQK